MKLTPHFVEKPWGGNFIAERFGLSPSRLIGEAFLVSTLEGQENFFQEKLPYLIKVIDAADNLSIQVHPDDYWAKILEASVGKTECWLVLDAEANSGVYYGFKEGVTFDDLIEAIKLGKDASECLNFIKVKPGDFISVPAGTIHAIGKGVRILEFQQSSGITYRIWDWNREGRELHLEKAKKVTVETVKLLETKTFQSIKVGEVFYQHEDFNLKKISDNLIECLSEKVKTKFHISVDDLKCEMA